MRRFYFDQRTNNLYKVLYEVEVVTYGKQKNLFNIKIVKIISSASESKEGYKANTLITNVTKDKLFISMKKATEWFGEWIKNARANSSNVYNQINKYITSGGNCLPPKED